MVVGLTVALTACTSSSSTVHVPADVRAALVAVAAPPADLGVAHTLVQSACLKAAGFDVPFDSSSSVGIRSALFGVKGLFASEDAARAAGYATTTKEAGSLLDIFESQLPKAEKAKFELANWGDGKKTSTIDLDNGAKASRNEEGCFADADRAVYGSVHNGLELDNFVNDIDNQAAKYTSDASGTLTTKLGQYASCMSSRGLHVTALDADTIAGDRFGKYRAYGEAPNADEQALAVTDFLCQSKAGFSSALDKLFLDKAAAWIVENESKILGVQEILRSSMARARQTIDAG